MLVPDVCRQSSQTTHPPAISENGKASPLFLAPPKWMNDIGEVLNQASVKVC